MNYQPSISQFPESRRERHRHVNPQGPTSANSALDVNPREPDPGHENQLGAPHLERGDFFRLLAFLTRLASVGKRGRKSNG